MGHPAFGFPGAHLDSRCLSPGPAQRGKSEPRGSVEGKGHAGSSYISAHLQLSPRSPAMAHSGLQGKDRRERAVRWPEVPAA